MIRFIGDVHGKYEPYKRLIADVDRSIQVGDLGVGFRRTYGSRLGEEYGNPPHYAMTRGEHRFIRGNHDNLAACKQHSQWIPDGHVEDGMMFVGGALSIDRAYRLEGYNWWPDEELSEVELERLAAQYVSAAPRIMVTHECPDSVALKVAQRCGFTPDPRFSSRTRRAFQTMWRHLHRPNLWVFGHWHTSFDETIEGTRFICLAELEYRDIDPDAI